MDFPNLPYFFDGDLKFSETMAIHKYIADKWDNKLLGTTPEQRATANMYSGVISDLNMGGLRMPAYGSSDKEPLLKKIADTLPGIV